MERSKKYFLNNLVLIGFVINVQYDPHKSPDIHLYSINVREITYSRGRRCVETKGKRIVAPGGCCYRGGKL